MRILQLARQPENRGLMAAILYGSLSISLIFVNKIVVTTYSFKLPMVLAVGQMISTLFILKVCHMLGKISLPNLNREIVKRVLPLSLAFIGNATVGFVALRMVNVPMYTALRRFTTVFVMSTEVLLLKKVHSTANKVAVGIMVLGAIVASLGDLNFDVIGYGWVMINNIFTACYLVLVKRINSNSRMDVFSLLYLNNILTLPLMLVLGAVKGEFSAISSFEHWSEGGFQLAFVMSCIQAFFLNYSIYLCTTLNSPLTTTVTGQLTKIVTTLGGYLGFSDVYYDPTNVIGLAIGLTGSIYYSILGYQSSQASNAAKKDESEERLLKDVEAQDQKEELEVPVEPFPQKHDVSVHHSHGVDARRPLGPSS